jgi:hypothetical protein
MHFIAHLSVTIAGQNLVTVCRVTTNNETAHIGSSCEIEVPLNCAIQYLDYVTGKVDYINGQPQVLFKIGDQVTVTAYYEGYGTINIFSGFIDNFVYGMPMKIRCADYIYNLNQGVVTISNYNGSLQNLCTQVLNGTGVTLILPVFDLTLVNMTFRLMSPAAILEYIKKELGLCITLMGSQLYVNVASNTRNTVIHRTDRNVLRTSLQQANTIFQNYRVRCWFININGTKSGLDVGNVGGRMREQFFYNIPNDSATRQKLATEALNKVKLEKFTGSIETMLYPDCNLFDLATYTSIRYPATNGQYVITSMNFDLSMQGFRRKIKYGQLNTLDNGS